MMGELDSGNLYDRMMLLLVMIMMLIACASKDISCGAL